MAGQRHNFDIVRRVASDAVGQPGRRRFRVIIQNEAETAFLWLEKEQLQALGLAVDQMLTPVKPLWSRQGETKPPATVDPFTGRATVEVNVGRLGLGFDETSKLFLLVAHDAESNAEGPPTFQCRCSRSQLSQLSESIAAVTTSGRPRCPVCGSPLDGNPHFCPGSNGHSH
jgi:uncharacterized repeat protein (TIGR03847 family)